MAHSWREVFLTGECLAGSHEDCRHVYGLQGEQRPLACHCDCHASCPVFGRDIASWESCICPGMARWREKIQTDSTYLKQRRNLPVKASRWEFAIQLGRDVWKERRTRINRQRSELAVKRATAGKTEQEIREMLLEEYKRRGVKPFPLPLLDNVVARMSTDDPERLDRLAGERKELLRELFSSYNRLLDEILPDADELPYYSCRLGRRLAVGQASGLMRWCPPQASIRRRGLPGAGRPGGRCGFRCPGTG
jgi:hypothetical protein